MTELRLLILPGSNPYRSGNPAYRWVSELNGHPGHCAEDHWHYSVEEALKCWRGERNHAV